MVICPSSNADLSVALFESVVDLSTASMGAEFSRSMSTKLFPSIKAFAGSRTKTP